MSLLYHSLYVYCSFCTVAGFCLELILFPCFEQVTDLSFYDVLLDFVLLDAFDDLETPPYSVATAVQNRWLSARIKETVSCQQKNNGPIIL